MKTGRYAFLALICCFGCSQGNDPDTLAVRETKVPAVHRTTPPKPDVPGSQDNQKDRTCLAMDIPVIALHISESWELSGYGPEGSPVKNPDVPR